jgi:hypothetical protein
MRKPIALGFAAATLLAAPAAIPCGMPFATNIRIEPAQEIIITHKGTTETYQFSPHFCGQVKDFGLILPVPGTLVSNPAIGDYRIKDQLAIIAAPTVVTRTECATQWNGGSGGGSIGAPGGYGDGGGVTVINAGTVGIFDWTLLKADTTKAFTDWLDTNGYPHQAAAQTVFGMYVTDGWYFVAFKVTAADQAPPAGRELCGDLGPIRLSFTSPKVVIPARITAAGGIPDSGVETNQRWHVFTITARDQQLAPPTNLLATLQFAGSLAASDLDTYLAVAPIAAAGDRLNEFNLEYRPSTLTKDIWFDSAPTDTDFRRVIYNYVYVNCGTGGGGSGGSGGNTNTGGSGGLGGTGGVATGGGGTGGVSGGSGGLAGSGGSSALVDAAAGGSTAVAGAGGSSGNQPGTGGSIANTGGATSLPDVEPLVVGGGDSCSLSAGSRGSSAASIALGLVGALLAFRRRRRQTPD